MQQQWLQTSPSAAVCIRDAMFHLRWSAQCWLQRGVSNPSWIYKDLHVGLLYTCLLLQQWRTITEDVKLCIYLKRLLFEERSGVSRSPCTVRPETWHVIPLEVFEQAQCCSAQSLKALLCNLPTGLSGKLVRDYRGAHIMSWPELTRSSFNWTNLSSSIVLIVRSV